MYISIIIYQFNFNLKSLMIVQGEVDQIVYGTAQPQEIANFIQKINKNSILQVVQESLQSFCKKQKLNTRDFEVFGIITKKAVAINMFKQNYTIFNLYPHANRIGFWINILLAAPKSTLEKHRLYWHKFINNKPQFWGYQSLDRFFKYITKKDKSLYEKFSKADYQRQLKNIQYIRNFFSQNSKLLPVGFDFREIIIKYICMIRYDTPAQEKGLLNKLIDMLLAQSVIEINYSIYFRYCFQFYRYEFDPKVSPFTPQKPIFEIIQRLSEFYLVKSLNNAFLGLQWTVENFSCSLNNCIKMGLTYNMGYFMKIIKDIAIKNNKIEILVSFVENQLFKSFVYLKFEKHFEPALKIFKQFIIGAPVRGNIYQKCLAKAKSMIEVIPKIHSQKFIQFLYLIKLKYQNSIQVETLTSFLNGLKFPYTLKPLNLLQQELQSVDWISSQFINFQKPTTPYRGLINIGNSCYMNSFLQSLYITSEFRFRVLTTDLSAKQIQIAKKDQSQLRVKQKIAPLIQLQKLFAFLYKSKRPYVNPSFMKNVVPLIFKGNSQQDAAEFGRMFLQRIQESIQSLLEGECQIIIYCSICQNERKKIQKFVDLIVPLNQQGSTIQELLVKHRQPEMIENLECNICNKKVQKSFRKVQLKKLPPYVIITLARFSYDPVANKKKKISSKVIFQQQITLEQEGNKKLYELYSLIVHRGTSTECGHYYTFSKIDSTQNWACFDDSTVTMFGTLEKVRGFLDSSPQDTPYLLFYGSKIHIESIKNQPIFNQPLILSQKLLTLIQKQDLQFLKQTKKKNFTLPKIDFTLFRKDDNQDNNPGSGGSHLIM